MISTSITLVLTIIFLVLTIFSIILTKEIKRNVSAKTVELKDGSYEVGKDLEPGHYTISSKIIKVILKLKL